MKTRLLNVIFLFSLVSCSQQVTKISPKEAHKAHSKTELEIVAELNEPPGNIAVSPDSRLFVSAHPMGGRARKVFEVVPQQGAKDFLPAQWANAPVGNSKSGIVNLIALKAYRDHTLWMLDMGDDKHLPRVVVWDLQKNLLKKIITFPKHVVRPNSFFQDFAVDHKNAVLVVADMTMDESLEKISPALVVLDLKSGKAKRRLERSSVVMPEAFPMIALGKEVVRKLPDGRAVKPALGINPIALNESSSEFIFGAMQGATLYSVETSALIDPSLSDELLTQRVRKIGKKSLTDGIALDEKGRIYSADVVHGAIGRTSLEGKYEFYILYPERLQWPDGLALGPDGYMYVTVNQLNLLSPLNAGKDESKPPFLIARFKVLD